MPTLPMAPPRPSRPLLAWSFSWINNSSVAVLSAMVLQIRFGREPRDQFFQIIRIEASNLLRRPMKADRQPYFKIPFSDRRRGAARSAGALVTDAVSPALADVGTVAADRAFGLSRLRFRSPI